MNKTIEGDDTKQILKAEIIFLSNNTTQKSKTSILLRLPVSGENLGRAILAVFIYFFRPCHEAQGGDFTHFTGESPVAPVYFFPLV